MATKMCRENAGVIICSDSRCEHCGWHGKEIDRRKAFIRENGLCRVRKGKNDVSFAFLIKKETGEYVRPNAADKQAWQELKNDFDYDLFEAQVHEYNNKHRNEK